MTAKDRKLITEATEAAKEAANADAQLGCYKDRKLTCDNQEPGNFNSLYYIPMLW